jgi:hypothetical protein
MRPKQNDRDGRESTLSERHRDFHRNGRFPNEKGQPIAVVLALDGLSEIRLSFARFRWGDRDGERLVREASRRHLLQIHGAAAHGFEITGK